MNTSNTHQLVNALNTVNNAVSDALLTRDQEIGALRTQRDELKTKLSVLMGEYKTVLHIAECHETQINAQAATIARLVGRGAPQSEIRNPQSFDEHIQPDAPEEDSAIRNPQSAIS